MDWTTQDSRSSFSNGSWIQSYAQYESLSQPGMYNQVTCNVGYESKKSQASQIDIGTFFGPSIAVSATGEAKWNSYGTPLPAEIPEDLQFQRSTEPGSYATNAISGAKSSQRCRAETTIYQTIAEGVPKTQELSDRYFNAMKEMPEFTVYTGFRIWKKTSKADYQKSADGPGVSYKF